MCSKSIFRVVNTAPIVIFAVVIVLNAIVSGKCRFTHVTPKVQKKNKDFQIAAAVHTEKSNEPTKQVGCSVTCLYSIAVVNGKFVLSAASPFAVTIKMKKKNTENFQKSE